MNDRRPLIGLTGDKLASKRYAAERGIPSAKVLWTGTDISEFERQWTPEMGINWVLKPNFSSGHFIFGSGRPNCRKLRNTTDAWLMEGDRSGEWAYSQAERVLIAEQFLGELDAPMVDLKFFVFQGEVLYCRRNSASGLPRPTRWYTANWEPTNLRDGGHALAEPVPPPDCWERLVEAASVLGRDFDFVRVDLYEVEGTPVFGELTAYPAGGLAPLDPRLEYELGQTWHLPALPSVGE